MKVKILAVLFLVLLVHSLLSEDILDYLSQDEGRVHIGSNYRLSNPDKKTVVKPGLLEDKVLDKKQDVSVLYKEQLDKGVGGRVVPINTSELDEYFQNFYLGQVVSIDFLGQVFEGKYYQINHQEEGDGWVYYYGGKVDSDPSVGMNITYADGVLFGDISDGDKRHVIETIDGVIYVYEDVKEYFHGNDFIGN